MKRVLVMSRPVVNAGDFLFTEKLREAVRSVVGESNSDCTIEYLEATRDRPVEFYNSFDSILLGGGPFIDNAFLSARSVPLLSALSEIRSRVSLIGVGWYGKTADSDEIYNYRLSDEALNVLHRMIDSGGIIGCRDEITQYVLNSNGILGTVLTGCPAWYPSGLQEPSVRYPRSPLRKILLSNAGLNKPIESHIPVAEQSLGLVDMVQSRYPQASLGFTFNGGIETKYSSPSNLAIVDGLKRRNVEYWDISGDIVGFGQYDDADMHIGYRVHSHLYCLSKGIPSLLIEEDARGAGANRVLGLKGPAAYTGGNPSTTNPYLLNEVSSVLDGYEATDFLEIGQAMKRIGYYSKNMKTAIAKAIA